VGNGVDGSAPRRLTDLTEGLLAGKKLGTVEAIQFPSAYDHRVIAGWIIKPPGFDPSRKYPLILEIHGGPYLNYGPRWGAELQLYAEAGYVVLYTNPRGSTSYGEEFGNLIHLDYPDHDYDDLMTGVDTVIGRGYVDPSRLFVVGGSGGGVLTAWIVGHTHRFHAAVVAKPVINWYSFALTTDAPGFIYRYWMTGLPWQQVDEYFKRSPISFVDSVTTPTMVVTGERDFRTPSEEAEQFYEALKLRRVPAAMLRLPTASHDIAEKPSNMIGLVGYVLGWFARYGGRGSSTTEAGATR
jgi:acylaminoacyl-peptidase